MKKHPAVHLICNAHLDPVWQWRWEEGCAEALATFRNAVELLNEHDNLIFNHNEAILYQWVERYDPSLFKEIQRQIRKGRWSVSGGWYLQPDLNLPGLESLVRQVVEGRRYFKERFNIKPRVAYNFDSFGHSAGLPQLLRLSGYKMYIHMRPQKDELELPSDFYRWRGVDGSEVIGLRISVGLYHTERDNIEQRLGEGVELALKLERDVPVFWGLGNHGGGATREDLKRIDEFIFKEKRVRIIHSTPDLLYESLKKEARNAPLFEGDLQRVFTGCYTSLSRIKREAQKSLGRLVQTEALRAATWWAFGQKYPKEELSEAWRDHLLNDFHDIITGTCTQSAEQDALGLYGKVEESLRRLCLGAAAAFNRRVGKSPPLPITVLNANPSLTRVPVEVECMLDYRPRLKGNWHLRLFRLDGKEILCQEEQPESLLPFNRWRRKVCFFADLPSLGSANFRLDVFKGKKKIEEPKPALLHRFGQKSGLVISLAAERSQEFLKGPLFEPLVIEDKGDSWGTGIWSYRNIVGRFKLRRGSLKIIERGPVRTVTESILIYKKSRIVLQTIAYSGWPVLEFRLRVHWNEERKMLKLSVPTAFEIPRLLGEIPGGVIHRPADGQEHVLGSWFLIQGKLKGKEAALGVVNSGQHGIDFADGEVRLSVLRSAAYCHEKGFRLGKSPARKFIDQGIHDLRLLIAAGEAINVRRFLPGLADWLSAPPVVYSHLPFGLAGNEKVSSRDRMSQDKAGEGIHEILSLEPETIRMTACKQSWDGKALVVRMQEMSGKKSRALLKLRNFKKDIRLFFKPFEIKTLRFEKRGTWREADLISET